jgi:hemerythrin
MWASDCQVYSDYLRLEHKQIHKVVKGIERAIQKSSSLHGDLHLETALDQLRELLVRHFEQEEDGGCLEQAACCCPRLSKAVSQIAGEHKSLLSQLDALITRARGGLTAADISEFLPLLEDFTRHLDAHDAAENHVLEEAFGQV